jgi:hypothetical protein
MDPARMFLENLTPSPELENSLGHSLQIVARRKSLHVRCSPKATVGPKKAACRDGPRPDSRGCLTKHRH